jgi:hypothetical protein
MKRILTLVLSLLVTPMLFAGDAPVNLFIANFAGTAIKQVTVGENTRAATSPVNSRRVFDEFGVSPDDYALVLNLDSSALVSLVPKSASAALPTITVLQIAEPRTVKNSMTKVELFEVPVANTSASGNIFDSLRGTLFGSLKFAPDKTLSRFNGNLTGSSGNGAVVVTSPAKGAVAPATVLLKFKVTKGARFTQAP